MSKRKVAIMGGSFNPIHNGHLIMANQALHQCQLDEVLWIPAGDPPHKRLAPGATSQDRLTMVKLAIASNPGFTCTDIEVQRSGRSYAVETLEMLTRQNPDIEWHWIIGLDALKDLTSWYRVERVVELCQWIVAPRVTGYSLEDVVTYVKQQLPIRYTALQAPYIEISSTSLRQQIQHDRSIRYLVPPEVETYIEQHHLYRPACTNTEP